MKDINYSTLGEVILYTGPRGNGKTLAAVRQLVTESDSRRLVTNLNSLTLDHDAFELGELPNYKDSRILLDNTQFLADRRLEAIEVGNFWRFSLNTLRHRNTNIIMTAQNPNFLAPTVRRSIDTVIVPRLQYKGKEGADSTMVLGVSNVFGSKEYPPFKVQPYFRYYNTREILQPIRLTRQIIQLVGPRAREFNPGTMYLYFQSQADRLDEQLKDNTL